MKSLQAALAAAVLALGASAAVAAEPSPFAEACLDLARQSFEDQLTSCREAYDKERFLCEMGTRDDVCLKSSQHRLGICREDAQFVHEASTAACRN